MLGRTGLAGPSCPALAPTGPLHLPQVMIAACDTFRSGAVEQLKTHCARLNVPLYERGYEKDPAKVAFEAVKAAQRSQIDVLLVDTAGERTSRAVCAVQATRELCKNASCSRRQ